MDMQQAHRRAMSLLQQFDGGMEIGYSDFADAIFALALSVVIPHIHGDMALEKSDIWDRIVRKSASVNL